MFPYLKGSGMPIGYNELKLENDDPEECRILLILTGLLGRRPTYLRKLTISILVGQGRFLLMIS